MTTSTRTKPKVDDRGHSLVKKCSGTAVGDIPPGYHTKGPHDVSTGTKRAHMATPATGIRVRNEAVPEEMGYNR
jgi:hypothetical protein